MALLLLQGDSMAIVSLSHPWLSLLTEKKKPYGNGMSKEIMNGTGDCPIPCYFVVFLLTSMCLSNQGR